MELIMGQILEEARASWKGEIGEERATKLKAFLERLLPEYSEKLGLSQELILQAIEKARTYSAVNYYQEATFPRLADVDIYENQEALLKAIPSRKFRCPSCKGVSTNPYTCDSGEKRSGGEECDWKAWGFLGCLGLGYTFTIKDGFLKNPRIETVFMPLEMEKSHDTD